MRVFEKNAVLIVFACAIVLVSTGAMTLAAEDKKPDDISKGTTIAKDSRMNEEYVTWLLEIITGYDPELAKQLKDLKKTNPDKFHDEFYKANKKYMPSNKDKVSLKKLGGVFKGLMKKQIVWLEKNYPEEAAKLKKIQKDNPRIYPEQIILSRRKYGNIMGTQKENPELAELMKEELLLKEKRRELVGKVKTAKGKEADKFVKELKRVVSARFDLIIKKKQLQYAALERDIELLKKRIAIQKIETQGLIDSKEKTTKRRVQELLSDEEKNKWNK